MKVPAPNAVQSDLRYREILQKHDVLFCGEKRTRRQIERIIRMANSCSRSPALQGTKKKAMKDIADMWEKFLQLETAGKK